MTDSSMAFKFAGSGLTLNASVVPWDTSAFGFNVAQIETIILVNRIEAAQGYEVFLQWCESLDVRIVSCRLQHHLLNESMFLESRNFRFIEMVLHPTLDDLQQLDLPDDEFVIAPALENDLNTLREISERSFSNERYHVDPRINRLLADKRYGRWVINSFNHPRQRLLKVTLDNQIIAIFIVELEEGRCVYWHLTAIDQQWQGMGYGKRIWWAMLRHHQQEEQNCVSTTIAARNVAVLNLYAKLGFCFLSPEMTFHWIREDE